MCLHFSREGVETTLRRIFATTVIDDGISKQPIKPSHHGFAVAQLTCPLDTLGERVLEQIFGEGAASHAPFKKRKEDAMILDEGGENVRFGPLALAVRIHAVSLP